MTVTSLIAFLIAILQPVPTHDDVPSPLERVSQQHARLIEQRASDFYELPNGVILDAYRWHRVRATLKDKTDWKDIDADDSQKLGFGHPRFVYRPKFVNPNQPDMGPTPFVPVGVKPENYVGCPPLIGPQDGDWKQISDWIIVVHAPHVGAFATPTPGDWRVLAHTGHSNVIWDDALLRFDIKLDDGGIAWANGSNYTKDHPGLIRGQVHLIGDTADCITGETIKGVYLLQPNGLYQRHGTSLPSFKFYRLPDPMTPVRMAQLIEEERLELTRFNITKSGTSPDRTKVSWRRVPIPVRFKPIP